MRPLVARVYPCVYISNSNQAYQYASTILSVARLRRNASRKWSYQELLYVGGV